MEFGLPPISGVDPTLAGARAAGRAGSSGPSQARFTVPEIGPPPEVRAASQRAAARWHELRAQNRELHFEPDPDTGRIRVEVRDLDGNLIRSIPASEALEIAAGAPVA